MQKSFTFSGRASNPAKKKASPAQLAARKKFAEMARSGAFKKAKVTRIKKNPTKGEKSFKAGDMVITDKGQIGQVTYLKKQPAGYADVYKLLDVMANDPYKQTFLENGNYINGTRLKAYKKRAGKVKMNPMNEMREFTVIKWKRGKNTTNGNPVYEFILKDEFGGMHTGKTKPNAGWVYGISSVYEGDTIIAALEETKSGRVYMVDYGKRKSNPSKRSSSRSAVIPNPQAPSARSKFSSNYKFSVEAKRLIPGGHTFEPIAGFATKVQAQDYVNAILASHKNVTLRIKSYK